MLRYQLLIQNDLLAFESQHEKINHAENAGRLIGPESFNENPTQLFGAIEAISPVCLIREKEWLFPFPVINQPDDEPSINPELDETIKGIVSWGNKAEDNRMADDDTLAVLKIYKEKTGFDTRYSGMLTQKVGRDEMYDDREKAQIGINKPRRSADVTAPADASGDNEGFFKLQARRLQDKVAFGFCVRLKNSVDFKEGPHPVQLADGWAILGKERSMFKMRVTPIGNKAPIQVPNLLPQSDAIWLLSDACVDPGILEHCRFVMTQPVNFRHMQTNLNQENYFAKPTRREARRELLRRGSLLFPKPGKQATIIAALNNPAFTKIGYNAFTILT